MFEPNVFYEDYSKTVLTIGALFIAFHAPSWIRAWYGSRLERNTPTVHVKAPEASHPQYTSRVIRNASITAHLEDPSLLPAHADQEQYKYLTCYDPATAYHIETIRLPTSEELSARIERAHAAFPKYKKTTFAQRRRLMRTLKTWFLTNMEDIVRVGVRDTGKTEVDAIFGEILTACSKIDYLLKYGEAALAPETRPTNLLLAHKVSKVHYEPLGVVCAIVSWNYPIHNAISPIIAALFAGNTAVLKCSEQVLWSTRWVIDALRACLEACDMDPEAVQLVCCYPEDARTITTHSLIKHITFIGSETVGRKVAMAAAENMIPTCIELGGKDCAILLPSADLKSIASTLMRAAFQANGQNCIGIERYLVHRSRYQEFLNIMTPRVQKLRCGAASSSPSSGKTMNVVDCGAMISSRLLTQLEDMLQLAEKQGARILAGGKRFSHPDWPEGHYFQPTLMADVTSQMDIATKELFAPVMNVIPYETVEQAIQIANGTRYGLGSAVFGNDRAECHSVAERLEVGMVAINDFGVFYLNQSMPFGGVKASGHGRFGGPEGLRSLCSVKSVTEDRFFKWIRTSIPPPVDYPLPARATTWGFQTGLVRLAYGDGMLARGKGLISLVKASMGM
ncbi:hypothetical protein NliqN6_3067 [Naganishia liquefaciens]|uniref:Aldehyde dehydrogenase domain-containing protein n=1 Tax=Naganishia liquefaciens TaxID=104408 RepID=A0A8H3YEK5_9TREE|nr:hypothetical protein NliqN6_3067 [Naganishia liquefaciens]